MAVAFPSSTQAASASGGGTATVNIDVDPPTGLTTGDIWLITAVLDPAATNGINTPSGFTAAHSTIDGDVGYPSVATFWKAAGASESAVNVSSSVNAWVLWCGSVRVTGANTSDPIGNVTTTAPSGTGTTVDAPDVTIQNNNSAAYLSVGVTRASGSDTTVTQPSGTTLLEKRDITTGAQYPSAGVAYELLNAGSYAPSTWGLVATCDGRVGVTIEILPSTVTNITIGVHQGPWQPNG